MRRGQLLPALLPVWVTAGPWGGKAPRRPPLPLCSSLPLSRALGKCRGSQIPRCRVRGPQPHSRPPGKTLMPCTRGTPPRRAPPGTGGCRWPLGGAGGFLAPGPGLPAFLQSCGAAARGKVAAPSGREPRRGPGFAGPPRQRLRWGLARGAEAKLRRRQEEEEGGGPAVVSRGPWRCAGAVFSPRLAPVAPSPWRGASAWKAGPAAARAEQCPVRGPGGESPSPGPALTRLGSVAASAERQLPGTAPLRGEGGCGGRRRGRAAPSSRRRVWTGELGRLPLPPAPRRGGSGRLPRGKGPR